MKKIFVELELSQYIDADYTDDIMFLDRRDYSKNLYEHIKKMVKMNHNNDLDVKEIDKAMFNYIEENYKEYIDDYIESFYSNDYKIDDLPDYDKVELSRYIIEDYLDVEDIEDLCANFNIVFSTVGYSDWTYVLCAYESGLKLANDMWEGYNFYDFTVYDSQGEIVDSIAMCHCEDSKDIDDIITYYFSKDDSTIYIVENNVSEYYNGKYNLADKVSTTTYNFIPVLD